MKHRLLGLTVVFLWALPAIDFGHAEAAQAFQPDWEVGERWTVETASRQPQRAGESGPLVRAEWQFEVEAIDRLGDRACLRIVARPTDAPQPKTTFWVDRATRSIVQFQTNIPTPDGYKPLTESYRSDAAAPVIAPLAVLPIALPAFPQEGVKGTAAYEYVAIAGPDGVKSIGDIGFVTEVRQSIAKAERKHAAPLLGDEYVKSLEKGEVFEVRLDTPDGAVRQFWRDGAPWPLWTENELTQARLIASTPAQGGAARAEDAPAAAGAGNKGPRFKSMRIDDQGESAEASYKPWSGYWWPIRSGGLLIPLGKYDRLTRSRACAWERKHNPPGPNVPRWHGFCHAWAASCILEREPTVDRVYRVRGGRLVLDIGDQKGLLAACHTEDLANSWGDRYGDGEGTEELADLRPDRLWRLLKLHIGRRGVPLLLDVEAGEEVWNYPVFQYAVQWEESEGEMRTATMTLLMADDAVTRSFRGTKVRKQTLRFQCKMRGGSVVMGSGQWVGHSRENHPDFAWYPYKAVASNPEVKHETVLKLLGADAMPGPQPETPDPDEPIEPDSDTPDTEEGAEADAPSDPPADDESAVSPTSPPHADSPDADMVPSMPQTPAGEPLVLSPMELVGLVAHETSSFEFDVTIDRFDGASYRPGETFTVTARSQRAGYLYLIQIDSTGTPSLLYPTQGIDNRIPAGRRVELRPGERKRGFPVTGPAGVVRVKAVVSSRPLAFSGLLEPAPTEESGPQPQATQAATFRWHPTQSQQVKDLLRVEQIDVAPAECRIPSMRLGDFAQDMVTFYVDMKPAGK